MRIVIRHACQTLADGRIGFVFRPLPEFHRLADEIGTLGHGLPRLLGISRLKARRGYSFHHGWRLMRLFIFCAITGLDLSFRLSRK
jgi:hypothetical protein